MPLKVTNPQMMTLGKKAPIIIPIMIAIIKRGSKPIFFIIPPQ
jgi:hypothetical protein